MLLGADKDEQKDPLFKTHLKFLINVIKQADKDGDMKISFEVCLRQAKRLNLHVKGEESEKTEARKKWGNLSIMNKDIGHKVEVDG
ncbi:hypothetical protein TELCIR_23934 [Teladorsagia circumcincta]|uniref:EF-hand domain-containing protein n=1 Tax=Teladorsagia circumcincta TaxID=45464 RepID=A0A2G9T9P5_TELCI|nr:hypothetical protein TELCIR_23934 [Teladorsagia circumcincta]